MIRSIKSLYSLHYPTVLVYMLQSTEYQPGAYLQWYWRTGNYDAVMHRRELNPTKAARLLLFALRLGIALQILLGLVLIYAGSRHHVHSGVYYGAAVLVSYPVVWAHLMVLPLLFGRWFIIKPREKSLIETSHKLFAATTAIKIAVAGSYGKTTMKELLLTVLSEGKRTRATPANKNVAISHALFAQSLTGDEEILVIEFGEGEPGDVEQFTQTVAPDYAVITGLAPAHLDHYQSVTEAGKDIFYLAEYVPEGHVFVNRESKAVRDFLRPAYLTYDQKGVLGWKISATRVSVEDTEFTMKKGSTMLRVRSGLLGRHEIGPLATVAAFAHSLGLSKHQIESALAKTTPFEHRMQPYALSGAWIIDDTYNGNIEGIRAGLELLKELPAKRKIYVTPGLVDQGKETESVHIEMGALIAKAQPAQVILMQNSVTSYIVQGMQEGGFSGELIIKDDPLLFYTNLAQFVAAGDLVLMQNDWTDNYA